MTSIQLKYIPPEQKYRFFSPFMKKDWAMLLDSGSKSTSYSPYRQFDIFTFEPSVYLQYQQDKLQVTENAATKNATTITKSTTEPFKEMRALLNKYTPNDQQSSAPFNGGWLGYISYDYGLEQLVTVKNKTQRQIEDDIPLIKMGLYQWALVSDHQSKTTILYNFGLKPAHFDDVVTQFKQLFKQIDEEEQSKSPQEPRHRLNENNEDFSITSPFSCKSDRQHYNQCFNAVKSYIQEGDCYQVNLAQQFEAHYSGSAYAVYHYLATRNNAPFSAYLNFPEFQILSLSPERFIESNNQLVKTQPIKGTLPRNDDPKIDKKLAAKLLNSKKDKAENLMIVDLMRNDLSKTATKNSVKVTELMAHYRFESVHHLISTIESRLSEQCDNFDLLETCLPGGSITGAPKKRAMEIIDELETASRGIYCGIIGYIDFSGKMDSNICIRTLLCKDSKLLCWAGGGLVNDSVLEQEYQETFDKLSKIIPPLNSLFAGKKIDELI